MKKVIIALICILFSLSACSKKDEPPKEKVYIEESMIANLYEDPEKYEGQYINISGEVFTTPETKDKLTMVQMWADPENNDKNTFVVFETSLCPDIKKGDYIKLTGSIGGKIDAKNRVGATISGPQINVDSIEISTAMDVLAPTIKSVDLNIVQEQNDVSITIQKVEFSENETRIYLLIDNKNKDRFKFYTSDAFIVQGDSQFKEKNTFGTDYKKLDSEILPNVKSEGIITFPTLEIEDFKLICSGHSTDYKVKFEDFNFDITIK